MKTIRQKQQALTLVSAFFLVGTVCVLILTVMGATQSPTKIEARKQHDSPIVLSNLYVDASEPTKPKYSFMITNVSDKSIRAFAIRDEANFSDAQAKSSGVKLSHLPSLNLLFLPTQSRQEESGDGTTYQQAVDTITLSVDFVEFTDGTRWGADTYKSADLLAGSRAGGKAALKKFREKLKASNSQALLDGSMLDAEMSPDKPDASYQWKDGFGMGVSLVRNRLKRARDKGGLAEIKEELSKPFDAAEGRQQP